MNKNGKLIAIIISVGIVATSLVVLGTKMKEKKKTLSNSNPTKNREIEIVDHCDPGSIFPDAIEDYYKDENYICSFNQVKSGCYTVKVDGKEYSLREALEKKIITVEEAIEEGMYCKKITVDDKSNTNTNTNSNTNSNSEPTNSNSNTGTNTNTNLNNVTNTNSNNISSTNTSSNQVSNTNITKPTNTNPSNSNSNAPTTRK